MSLHILEAKIAIFVLFPGIIILLRCISAIIDFDVLCTLWVFIVDLPLMGKLGCWFARLSKNDVETILYLAIDSRRIFR